MSLIFCTLIYWAGLRTNPILKCLFLSSYSLILVLLLFPVILAPLLSSCVIAYLYKFFHKFNHSDRLAGLFIFLQLSIMFIPDFAKLTNAQALFTIAGISYFTLRNIGTVIDIHKGKISPSLLEIIFVNSFFPTFSAGPIENLKTLNINSCSVKFNSDLFVSGVLRIFSGIVKFYFISNQLFPLLLLGLPTTPEAIIQESGVVILGYVLLSWLNLYIVFSGYSDIAIGSSRLFGINVRENFNLPFLATNIQKYWQRWNISIMNFVSEYIYINFVRVTGKRVFGIFIAFFFMGMAQRFLESCDLGTWAFASNDNIFLLPPNQVCIIIRWRLCK